MSWSGAEEQVQCDERDRDSSLHDLDPFGVTYLTHRLAESRGNGGATCGQLLTILARLIAFGTDIDHSVRPTGDEGFGWQPFRNERRSSHRSREAEREGVRNFVCGA